MSPRIRFIVSSLAVGLRLAAAAAALGVGVTWRAPWLVELRPWLLVGTPAVSLTVLAFELRRVRTARRGVVDRAASMLAASMCAVALIAFAGAEVRFRRLRHEVRHAEPERLARLGRHLVVGYRDRAEVAALVELRAIGGVFVTARNVAGRDAADVGRELEAFQAARRRTGEPPLWIAADQEGGPVSRLSPPLEALPALSTIAARCGPAAASCEDVVRVYAAVQGSGLASLGVNLNFAPVVDLDHHVVNPGDGYTRIRDRAIGSDPALVARVAEAYCDGLSEARVACTLKHFPGLGRVFDDTHRAPAVLAASPGELAVSDWRPFREVMRAEGRFTMLGHARLTAVDPVDPASISRAVVGGLVRGAWGHDGPLVTDDLCMMAIYRSPSGIGDGAVAALNAGVDLLLVSYDPDQYVVAMAALLEADRSGRLDANVLRRSEERLARAWGAVRGGARVP